VANILEEVMRNQEQEVEEEEEEEGEENIRPVDRTFQGNKVWTTPRLPSV
jgi:hypothetical protein